jgi:hypothetical protein
LNAVDEAPATLPAVPGGHQQDLWRKTVKVIHSVPQGHSMTLVQRKIANAWMRHAIENPRDKDGWWKMSLGQLRQQTGFASTNTVHLKDAARALMRIIFEYDVFAPAEKRGDGWKAQVLFPGVAISGGFIHWQITENIYRELLRPEVYAIINMAVMRKFSSNAALQLWEFCVRFENIGITRRITWEEFRDVVIGGAEKSSLSEYKVLKKRILTPAIAEINTCSDHEVELLEFRSGRRIAEIQFRVQSKQQAAEIPLEAQKLLERMIRLGVPAAEAKRLAIKYPVARLHTAVRYTELRQTDTELAPLEAPAAYFRRALEQGWGISDAEPVQLATSPSPTVQLTIDPRDAEAQKQRAEAKAHYTKLRASQKDELRQRYNEQQHLPNMRVKSRFSKLSEVAFFNWMAKEMWGDPA